MSSLLALLPRGCTCATSCSAGFWVRKFPDYAYTHPDVSSSLAVVSPLLTWLSNAIGHRRERERRVVHCASSRPTNGAIRERRKHHPHCEHERFDYQQGEFKSYRKTLVAGSSIRMLPESLLTISIGLRFMRNIQTHVRTVDADVARRTTCPIGSCVGQLQLFQISRPSDGPQYGLRARTQKDQSQHAQSRSHLHEVRHHNHTSFFFTCPLSKVLLFARLLRRPILSALFTFFNLVRRPDVHLHLTSTVHLGVQSDTSELCRTLLLLLLCLSTRTCQLGSDMLTSYISHLTFTRLASTPSYADC